MMVVLELVVGSLEWVHKEALVVYVMSALFVTINTRVGLVHVVVQRCSVQISRLKCL
jgi:hypothetical protein